MQTHSTMQRCATLLLAIASSADASNSLRGGSHDGRILYGTEYGGINGLQAVFSSVGVREIPVPQHSGKISDTDPDFVGKEVFLDSSEEPENDISTRIVGGYGSNQQKSYAMHLRFQSTDSSWHYAGCGGTLISSCHVLTAAHCVANGRAGLPDGVYVNAYRPFMGNNDGVPYHFSHVSKVHVHPQFNDGNNQNDVAVITMSTCANTNDYPIMRVADAAFIDGVQNGEDVSVSGLGRLSSSNSALVDQLQRVEVPFIETVACDEYYPGRIEDDMICAGYQQGGKDSCQGDSGGPLFMDQGDGSQVQIGVVSWGSGCAQANKPGVYASVGYHYDFIQEEVCGHEPVDTNIELCGFQAPLTPAPVPAPTLPPAASPTVSCGALNDMCYSSLDCCGNFQCQPRDGQCKQPSNSGNYGKQSVNKRRRRNGN